MPAELAAARQPLVLVGDHAAVGRRRPRAARKQRLGLVLGQPAPARAGAPGRGRERERRDLAKPPGVTRRRLRIAAAQRIPVRSPATAGTPGLRKPPRGLVVEQLGQRRARPSSAPGCARAPAMIPVANRAPGLLDGAGQARGLVVEDQHLADAGSSPSVRPARPAPRCRPRSSRCSRAGWRPSPPAAAARAAASRVAGASAGSVSPSARASSAPWAESPPEQVMIARPRARRPPAPRRPPASWPARADRGRRRAQTAPASSIEAAEHALVAGQRGAVGGRRARARRGELPDLQHHHRHAGLGARRQPVAQAAARRRPRGTARPRRTPVLGGQELEVVGGVEHRLVAARDHRVEAQPPAGGQRVDRDVAALGDQRHRARPRAARARRPTARSRVARRDDPVAVGPAHRQPVARRRRRPARACSAAPSATSPKPALNTTAPPQPQRARLLDHLGHARGRDRDDHGVDRAPAGRRAIGTHGRPSTSSRLGLTPHTVALEADRLEVEQRLRGVAARPVGGADDRDRARVAAGAAGRTAAPSARRSMDRRLDAAALERAGDDQPLDLAGPLPDPVHPQLAVEPLGDVASACSRGRRTPARRGRRSGRRPRTRTAWPSTPWRGSAWGRRRRRPSRRPAAPAAARASASVAESASGNEIPW